MTRLKRLVELFFVLLLTFHSVLPVYACDEERTKECTTQILFGDRASKYDDDQNVKMLLDALYICSEQSDGNGKQKLTDLKAGGVWGVPSVSKINVSNQDLLECSHNAWDHPSTYAAKSQKNRKELLQNTVNEVFDFGFVNEVLDIGQGNSFSAILYYSHILADYLADDPDETEVPAGGRIIPSYSGIPYTELNGNRPSFSSSDKKVEKGFKEYSGLDGAGRAGKAFACIGPETMPSADSRQQIGYIKPTGWNQNQYPGLVNSQPPYLFNRCHLIAHQLAGNDGKDNLITGTRYLNINGMKPFEDMTAEYVRTTGNHVLYRATPVYVGNNKLASGVQLEAYSLEDKGKGISFNVYCYNVQPGVDIDYTNGVNSQSDDLVNAEGDIIPFAAYGADDDDPDLIYAMDEQLTALFSDQKSKKTYQMMENRIHEIADEARQVAGGTTNAKQYIELKKYEYDYLDVLSNYVPILLKNEKFFYSVFN